MRKKWVAFALASALSASGVVQAQDEVAAERLLDERGCLVCHSLDGSARVGPSFAAAAASVHSVSVAGGEVEQVEFDAAYVVESILDPDARLAGGHGPGAMPRLANSAQDARVLADAVLLLAQREPAPVEEPRSILWVLLASLAFVLGHLVLSSRPLRGPLVRRLGEGAFAGVYSVLVLAAFVWLVVEWIYAPYVELFRPPAWTRWIPNLLMPISYVLLVAGFTTKSPTLAGAGGAASAGPIGFIRITRHPSLWGFALWGLSHLATNGDVRSLALMGGFALLSLAGMWHIDARRRASGGEAWRDFESRTSVLPFLALLRGQPRPTWAELGWWRVLAGIAGWAVMLHLHRMLLGVSPLP